MRHLARARRGLPPAPDPHRLRQPLLLTALVALALVSGCRASLEDRLAEARSLQEGGLFVESIEPLTALLQEEPGQPQASELLGIAYLQTNQPSLAIYPLDEAARSPEHTVSSGTLLAAAYSRTEQYEGTVEAADRVLAVAPDQRAARYLRAQALLGMGKQTAALEDADRLLESNPDDYQALLLRAATLWDLKRLDEAERAYQRLAEAAASQGPEVRVKGRLALATFYRNKGDQARAQQEFDAILREFPTDPTALSYALQLYDETERSERGTELVREALKAAPENPSLHFFLASRLQKRGDPEGAEAVLTEAVSLFGTPEAWLRLAELREQQGRLDAALEAIDEVVAQVGEENEPVNLKRAQLLVAKGEAGRAREVLATVKEESARAILEGQLLLAEGKPEEALAQLDTGLRRWPNNAGARLLTGQAALALGQLDRAASELREAYRSGPEDTDAALLLADLDFRRGDYPGAFEFAGLFLQKRQSAPPESRAEAFSIAIRSASAMHRFDAARRAADELGKIPGQGVRAALERAGIARQASGPAAAAAAIEKSGLDLRAPESEPALRALVGDLLAQAKTEDAARRVDAAVAAHPEHAAFYELRGLVAARRERLPEAREAFERALALEPEQASTLVALATLEAQEGKADAALALLARAEAAAPDDPAPAYQAAQLLLAAGRSAEAEARLRAIVRAHPTHASARNDLAWILAERQAELDFALALAQEASRIAPNADTLDTLGWVQLQRGDAGAAVESFRRALADRPDAPSIRYRLGLALQRTGDTGQALQEIEASLASGTEFPEADEARAEAARLRQAQGEPKEHPSS